MKKQAKKAKIGKEKKEKKKVEPERQRHEIDLKGKVFGRAASEVALLLSGKRKVGYLPHVDGGDYVTVYNLGKVKIRGGSKLKKKIYYRYTGYPGGIRGVAMEDALAKNSQKVFRMAVWGMLPKNRLRKAMIKRLIIHKERINSK